MRRLLTLFLVFLVMVFPFLSIFPVPQVSGQPQTYFCQLDLERPYGFRGENINLTATSDYLQVIVETYLPNGNLWKNETYSANETKVTTIPNQAPFGEYRIVGVVPDSQDTVWFNVVDHENFAPANFPYLKTHKEVEYHVFSNKTLMALYRGQNLTIHLPDLPSGVSINCLNNSDIFVARFQSGVIDIDLSLVFVHDGAKLVINGTSDTQKDFSFKFYSPQQIKRYLQRIEIQPSGAIGVVPNILMFDWSDFVKVGEHLSYNHTTHILTVHDVPETFRLDPSFGYDEQGPSGPANRSAGYTYGCLFQMNDETGTTSSISVYVLATTGAGEMKVALYENDAGGVGDLLDNEVSPQEFASDYDAFLTVSVGGYSLEANEWYWIWARSNVTFQSYYQTGAGPDKWDTLSYPSTWENPMVGESANLTNTWSLYCNYTTGAEHNFYGSIPAQASISSLGLTWQFTRYQSITASSTVDSIKTVTVPKYGSMNGQASIGSEETWATTKYVSLNPQTTVESVKTVSFTIYSALNPTVTVESFAEFLEQILNFFGSITGTASVTSENAWAFPKFGSINPIATVDTVKTVAFTIFSSLNPSVTVESFAEFIGNIYNFFGSITGTATVDSIKTVVFTLYPSLNPVVTVDGFFQILENIYNFFGSIIASATIEGWTDLPVPAVAISTSTAGLAIVALTIALGALVFALKRNNGED